MFQQVRFITDTEGHVGEYGDLGMGEEKLFTVFGSHRSKVIRSNDESIFENPLLVSALKNNRALNITNLGYKFDKSLDQKVLLIFCYKGLSSL